MGDLENGTEKIVHLKKEYRMAVRKNLERLPKKVIYLFNKYGTGIEKLKEDLNNKKISDKEIEGTDQTIALLEKLYEAGEFKE